jgi:hypothetical protein
MLVNFDKPCRLGNIELFQFVRRHFVEIDARLEVALLQL